MIELSTQFEKSNFIAIIKTSFLYIVVTQVTYKNIIPYQGGKTNVVRRKDKSYKKTKRDWKK